MIILFEQIINQFLCVSTGLNRSICAGSYSEFVVMCKKVVLIKFSLKSINDLIIQANIDIDP